MSISAPRGTVDILPGRIPLWRRLENAVREACERYGFEEIRTPVFESTPLFTRSVGEATDIVEKQMFTLSTREGEEDSLTLRPEITAPVIRAMVQNNMLKERGFWKLYYIGPAFRKERPQKGRQRQFHQFGIESVGSRDPRVDAESILLLGDILEKVGVSEFEVRINSLGDGACRPAWVERLRQAASGRRDDFCDLCRARIDRNVLRLLDCKKRPCRELVRALPKIELCGDCRAHDKAVHAALGKALPLKPDPTLVRGLDYYTRTVYEFTSPLLGAQDALGGGGRYDGLVQELDGPKNTGAVGFAAGIERVLIAMEAGGANGEAAGVDFYGVAIGEPERDPLFAMIRELRSRGLSGTMDFQGRSLKAQMRTANRLKARFALILGEAETAKNQVRLKNLRAQGDEQKEQEVSIDEAAKIMARR